VTLSPSNSSPNQAIADTQNPSSTVWLQGLMTIAWADGHLDPSEQHIIADLLPVSTAITTGEVPALAPADLAAGLGADPTLAENFMRTAVMVALADGLYSTAEDTILEGYCQALGLQLEILEHLRQTLDGQEHPPFAPFTPASGDVLAPVRTWLDGLDVKDPKVARFLCRMIPSQCPFERDVMVFGKKVVHIPAMCKINPLYEQLVGLRFRALSYLADDCQEDVSEYV
jgi:tellurite resistance protein